jgi:hypothetical protein
VPIRAHGWIFLRGEIAMADHTVFVGFNAKAKSWTFLPNEVDMTRAGWVIFRRNPGSIWKFVSVDVHGDDLVDGRVDWTHRTAEDGSSISIFDPNMEGEFPYIVTVQDDYGDHHSDQRAQGDPHQGG